MAVLDEVHKLLADVGDIGSAIERQRRAQDYIFREFENLLKEYRDKWIAVSDRIVVGYGKDPRALLHRLADRGFQRKDVTLQYITERTGTLLL